MTTACTNATAAPAAPPVETCPRHDAARAVWDRLWTHCPSDERDNALLARERRSTRWAMLVRAIEAAFGSPGRVRTIELGSGRGDLSALLAQQGARVTLLDASNAALMQASSRFHRLGLPAQYERADMLGPMEAYRGRFDVALSSGVIEHFKGADRTRVVRAHYEVLRPGGLAVISVPNAGCPPYRLWKAYLEQRGWWPYGMEIPYARRELERIARRVGFETTEFACYGFWQSMGAQFCRTFLRWSNDPSAASPLRPNRWYERRSILDAWMGQVLMLFARRPEPRAEWNPPLGGARANQQPEPRTSARANFQKQRSFTQLIPSKDAAKAPALSHRQRPSTHRS